jgi:putative resolvase
MRLEKNKKLKMTLGNLPKLLTLKQASELINVHPNTLRNWEKEGKIETIRIGVRKDRRFSEESLLKVLVV